MTVEKKQVLVEIRGTTRSGKTAIAQAITGCLAASGIEVTLSDEPDGNIIRDTALQERIMEVLSEQVKIHVSTKQMEWL